MSNFEKIILGVLSAAETLGPIFVHSEHGTAILNASEGLVASLAQVFAQKSAGNQTASGATK